MRATDIIRQVLDLLDQVQGQHDIKPKEMPDDTRGSEQGEPIAGRFKQIFAMLDNSTDSGYANTPNEIVAPTSAVTTAAGGGVNGPKHPHDIRVKDPSAYPDQQEY